MTSGRAVTGMANGLGECFPSMAAFLGSTWVRRGLMDELFQGYQGLAMNGLKKYQWFRISSIHSIFISFLVSVLSVSPFVYPSVKL
jgi:hypothetical protein